jgi:hypothetical protein
MSIPLEEAVRMVLDHGRNQAGSVEISAADFDALAGSYQATEGLSSRLHPYDNERDLLRLYESGYV